MNRDVAFKCLVIVAFGLEYTVSRRSRWTFSFFVLTLPGIETTRILTLVVVPILSILLTSMEASSG